jgi:hypothetical protein
MSRLALTAAALLLAAPAALPQGAPMRPFDLWVGQWKGAGWSISATGARTEFSLVERVERKAGGTVLMVEGRGTSAGADGSETVTHDGVALISYDAKAGRYRWNGHELLTGATDAEVRLVEGGLEWSLLAGGATVRFTILFDAERWHEVGDVSVDGKTWNRFMEMNLVRA